MEKFEVPVWWYELHGGTIKVEANSKKEAIEKVSEGLSNMIGDICGDTFSDFGDMGVDDDYKYEENAEDSNL